MVTVNIIECKRILGITLLHRALPTLCKGRENIMCRGLNIKLDNSVFIVAEMSANHMQDKDRAKRIIEEAAKAGADAIKIQTYLPDTITVDCRGEEFMCTPGSPWEGRNLYELYQTTYTPYEWHQDLFEYADKLGILLFSSPFDLGAIDLLEKCNSPIYKIASFEITDIPLIKKAAKTGKPIIMSTGLASLADIELAVNMCRSVGNDQIYLLKCVSEYPTPYEDINLRTLVNLKETFGCEVGLSDHTLSSSVAIAAVALGASIIEKHFTLSREDKSADAVFSMEPEEFKQMVQEIRCVEKALGKVNYTLTERQLESRKRSRSLYIVEDVKKGECLNEKNMKSVRPGYGLHTKYYEDLLEKRVRQDLKKGTPLAWKYIDEI